METIQQPGHNPDESKSSSSKILSVVGLVFGILTLIFSLVPCVGYYALIPAVIALILCGVAFYLQKKEKKPAQLALIGMVLSLLASGSAYYQYIQFKEVFDTKERAERVVKGIEEKIEKEAADAVIDYTKKKIDDYLVKDSIEEAEQEKQQKKQ